ncbi:hypothetical protein [Actinocorallia longicatena]|uniref:Uncharacterized protein n=1 Tax=Actinocorallia longicatena TaxID=111803 RepID=A0ABP6QHN6_9ACTN
MRGSLTAFMIIGVLGGTALAAVPAQAAQSAAVCSFERPPSLKKVVRVTENGVRKADRKRPHGWLSAKRTKVETTEEGNFWFKPYGKARSYPLAKKRVLCVVATKGGQIVMRRTTLAGFRKALGNGGGSSVAIKTGAGGRVTLAYQLFEA